MLVLSRQINQKIQIGDNITVTLLDIDANRVKLGFEAPQEIGIWRDEIWEASDGEPDKEAA